MLSAAPFQEVPEFGRIDAPLGCDRIYSYFSTTIGLSTLPERFHSFLEVDSSDVHVELSVELLGCTMSRPPSRCVFFPSFLLDKRSERFILLPARTIRAQVIDQRSHVALFTCAP